MENELPEKRIAALEVEVQRLHITRKAEIICITLGVAIADFVMTPLANLLFGLLPR